jgi:hypothetical protein
MGRSQLSIVIDVQMLVTHAATSAHRPSGLICKTGLHMPLPTTGETRMSSTTDHVHEGCVQTAHPSTDVPVADDPLDAPRETEASFEEIER